MASGFMVPAGAHPPPAGAADLLAASAERPQLAGGSVDVHNATPSSPSMKAAAQSTADSNADGNPGTGEEQVDGGNAALPEGPGLGEVAAAEAPPPPEGTAAEPAPSPGSSHAEDHASEVIASFSGSSGHTVPAPTEDDPAAQPHAADPMQLEAHSPAHGSASSDGRADGAGGAAEAGAAPAALTLTRDESASDLFSKDGFGEFSNAEVATAAAAAVPPAQAPPTGGGRGGGGEPAAAGELAGGEQQGEEKQAGGEQEEQEGKEGAAFGSFADMQAAPAPTSAPGAPPSLDVGFGAFESEDPTLPPVARAGSASDSGFGYFADAAPSAGESGAGSGSEGGFGVFEDAPPVPAAPPSTGSDSGFGDFGDFEDAPVPPAPPALTGPIADLQPAAAPVQQAEPPTADLLQQSPAGFLVAAQALLAALGPPKRQGAPFRPVQPLQPLEALPAPAAAPMLAARGAAVGVLCWRGSQSEARFLARLVSFRRLPPRWSCCQPASELEVGWRVAWPACCGAVAFPTAGATSLIL